MARRNELVFYEHNLQHQIHAYLVAVKVLHFETDVMSGLQFFSHTDYRRFAFIKHHKNMGYMKGQPDLIILYGGNVYFVELKTTKGKQSKEQKELATLMKEQGYTYLIWRSLDDCINFLKRGKDENI